MPNSRASSACASRPRARAASICWTVFTMPSSTDSQSSPSPGCPIMTSSTRRHSRTSTSTSFSRTSPSTMLGSWGRRMYVPPPSSLAARRWPIEACRTWRCPSTCNQCPCLARSVRSGTCLGMPVISWLRARTSQLKRNWMPRRTSSTPARRSRFLQGAEQSMPATRWSKSRKDSTLRS